METKSMIFNPITYGFRIGYVNSGVSGDIFSYC